MITGEHAVVYGHRAIVCAIEQRVFVTLTPREDRSVSIVSEIAPPLHTDLDHLRGDGPYRFVLAALALHQTGLQQGCELTIRSEIDPTLGLGSSAAVTVACLGVLSAWSGARGSEIHSDALRIIRDLQGRGSGADLAASLTGGFVAYKAPVAVSVLAEIQPLPSPPVSLSLKYCGYKTPTAEVLALIAKKMRGNETFYDKLYQHMGQTSESTIEAALGGDWPTFYAGLTRYQEQMEALGVCDDTLAGIVEMAGLCDGMLAAKISGSGLGDCVLALGAVPPEFEPVTISEKGLIIDA